MQMLGRQPISYFQNLIRVYIYEGCTRDFCDELLQLTGNSRQPILIDMICDELSAAFTSSSSFVVDCATELLNYLARNCVEEMTLGMAQKQFQDNLVYTLRGKTSYLGNRLTLHPKRWREIEKRVLGVYQFWFQRYSEQKKQYRYILQKYQFLKALKLEFPEDPAQEQLKQIKTQRSVKLLAKTEEMTQEPLQYDGVNPKQIELVDDLIAKYLKAIESGNKQKCAKSDSVTLLKQKCKHLYNIFTTERLDQQTRYRLQKQYAVLRDIIKQLDQNPEQVKIGRGSVVSPTNKAKWGRTSVSSEIFTPKPAKYSPSLMRSTTIDSGKSQRDFQGLQSQNFSCPNPQMFKKSKDKSQPSIHLEEILTKIDNSMPTVFSQ